jgi:alpha-glucosidase
VAAVERQGHARSVDDMEAALPPFAWPNYVLGNHDQPRLATRFGGQARRAWRACCC